MWTILKDFIVFFTILLLFYALISYPQGLGDLSSLTKDWPPPPALEGKVLTNGPPGKSRMVSFVTPNLQFLRNESWNTKGTPPGVSDSTGFSSYPNTKCYTSYSFPTICDAAFPGGSDSKESACNAEDLGSIPGLGRSPGVGNGNPLQYSCLRVPWMEEPGGLQSMGPYDSYAQSILRD